jgi:hypothetical protein
MLILTAASAAQAAEISVVAPTDHETVFSNQGKLTVKLHRVDAPPGAGVRLVLDGNARPKIHHGDVIQLHGIYRGSHTVQATLVGADGERLAASAPVSFYMWHASRLFPDRK